MKKKWLKYRLLKKANPKHKTAANKVGLPPGSLIYVGGRKTESARISVLDYGMEFLHEKTLENTAQTETYLTSNSNSWINVDGIDHIDVIEDIGQSFGLNKLLLEDLLNTQHRPKMDIYDGHIFLCLKMLKLGTKEDGENELITEQVSFVLNDKWLLSFQEEVGDVFDLIRKRLRNEDSQIRKSGIDYLFYRLIDVVIDHYFIITEHIGTEVEVIEDEMNEDLNEDLRWKMQAIRKQLLLLRKAVMPLRETIGNLAKEENRFVHDSTRKYFHDTYDHIIHLIEFIDTQRDMLSSLTDLYLSGVSYKMNQVMKVLTIISTIFIPLTFLAGIYGMNFINIPELQWEFGYFYTLGVMAVMVIAMLFYFKRKDWL